MKGKEMWPWPLFSQMRRPGSAGETGTDCSGLPPTAFCSPLCPPAGATADPLHDTDGGHRPERSVHRVPVGCSQAGHHPPAGSKPEPQSSRVTNQLFSLCPGGEFDSSPHISPLTMGTTAPVKETVLTSLELGSPSCEELTTGPTTSKCVWLLNTQRV